MKTIDTHNKPASDKDKQPGGPSRDRIRQDKFSTLPLPWLQSDINKQKAWKFLPRMAKQHKGAMP